jgi:pimeloyl-ACP methyl ester carboxylesterase
VLCIHGLTRNSADFEGVAPQMAAMGRRVVAVDVRGRGRSDRDPMPERYQPPVYVRDVVAVLDEFGIGRAVFVGTSMGGLMTMMSAVLAPERVAAGVLNDIGPIVDPRGLQRIAGYVGKSGAFASWNELIAAIKTAQSVAFPDADDPFWSVFARRVARERGDGAIEFDYDPAIARAFDPPKEGAEPPPAVDLMPLFQALAARPVLVLRGALSDILSVEGVEAMRAVKPDLEVAEVPRVGHAPTLEEPAAWHALSSFLKKIL